MQKVLDNPMRRHILKVLSIKNNLEFNELFHKEFYSTSKFTYHLNWLLKNNFITKNNGMYNLGSEGKKLVTYVDLESMSFTDQPLTVLGVLLLKNGKILASASKKQPFQNVWGLSCFGKLRKETGIEDQLKILCKKKLGYEIQDFKFSGVFNIKSIDKTKKTEYHHQIIVFTSDKFKGKLLDETETRYNKWVKINEFKRWNQYPDNQFIIKHLNSGKFFELERSLDKNSLRILNEF